MTFRLFNILILSTLASLFCQPALSARLKPEENYSVDFITMKEGLPHNFVDDIFRDSKGFIWISTSAALSRYDGYEFVSFTPNSPAHHVKSSFVRKVTEDRFGRLWVASDGGIDIICLSNLSNTVPAEEKSGELEKIVNIPSSAVCRDKEGNIWIRNSKDVACVVFNDEGGISEVLTIPHNTKVSVATATVKSLPGLPQGILTAIDGEIVSLAAVGYGAGKDGKRISKKNISPNLAWDPAIYISDFEMKGNILWIGTEHGLISYDRATEAITIYQNAPGVPGSLSQDFITSLAFTPKGELIAGNLNGLDVFDESTGLFRHVVPAELPGNTHNLSNNFINCLLTDGDMLWVGTEGSGVNIFSPRSLFSRMLRHDPSDPGSLSPNGVNAIYEDGDGTLWIGTVEGGLNRGRSGYEEGFVHFTKESGALPNNSVSAITSDHDGHLWVGTWGGGLCMLDRDNPSRPLKILTVTPDGLPMGYIGALVYDPFNNAVWIGFNAGLLVYDLDTGELFTPFKGAEEARGSVAAVIAPDGNLWIGGLDGIYKVNLRSDPRQHGYSFRHYPYKLNDSNSLVNEKVTAIATAHDATVWIGTNGNGLYRYNPDDDSFTNFNTADGLPNDIVHGIAEDLHGNLWIATYHGLGCITADNRFMSFGTNQGLGTEQFYWNAYRRLANGDILLGSVDGMVAIKGLAPGVGARPMPVRFTSLTVDNDAVYGNPERCKISENDRSFEIGFSAFDYSGENQGRYFYRMKGYEEEWKELPAGRHSVAYMNLFPGTYSLEVKYVAQGQDMESAPVSAFEVEIVPNFYRRWWFILLIVIAVIVVILLVYRWRVRYLKRQRNELRKAVEEGVKEISEQKAQVQQLTADRISFFTNITHEFRTPITLIIGPVERAMKLSTNPKVIEQLSFVARNSRYLLSLVNQLMDFRKIESGKMEAVTMRGDVCRLLDDIIVPFEAYAKERGISLVTRFRFSNPVFYFNEDSLRKVLTNLLGNAIKFTPDGGTVTFYAALLKTPRCGQQGAFYMCVSDTGSGLAPGEEEKVFDHFYQGKNQMKYPLIGAADSGIGLYLCRKLVELYGGTISARNNKGAGCSFRVVVPVTVTKGDNQPDERKTDAASANEQDDEQTADRKMTVLVVEDNADMRGFMRSVLSDHYNVVEADGGEAALKILLSNDVDLILSDLMMPGMDGLELASKVKENFALSHIPFVMLTAKTANESRLEGYRRGIDAYILKPFDEEMLLTRIHNLMSKRRQMQQRFVSDMKVAHLQIDEESSDKKFIDKVMEVLRDNYSNSYFEVGEFADALGVSRSLLNKKLQSLLGQSANQLMRSYRLKLAYDLIEHDSTKHNLNVSEISFMVGFNDSKYFTRCFTKQFGVTPSAMLKKERKETPELKNITEN